MDIENDRARSIWEAALQKAREGLSEHEFAMWFTLSLLHVRNGTYTAAAGNSFQRDQFNRKYRQFFASCLSDAAGSEVALEVVVGAPRAEPQAVAAALVMTAASPAPASPAPFSPAPSDAASAPSPATPLPNPRSEYHAAPSAKPRLEKHPMLRLDYRFENYVIGEHNKFAANAAEAVAKTPGRIYNPLLVYGGVGLGKTHLMHSVGNRVHATRPDERIICITAEEFTNEFIQTIHDRTTQAFKNKYRNADYLLIDDIHFLQNKPGVQEELFHTFNALYDADKQMVFTCDRPVSELKNLSDRLRSRFERGLNVDLQPPEYETRCAILKSKAASSTATVSDEVIEIIAKNVATNVRDLEAALTKLIAYADLVHQDITPEIARKQLKDTFSKFRHGSVTVDAVMRAVSEHYKLSFMDLKGKKRSKNIAFPRQVAMFIIREITEYSTTEIGMEFGGRDHTTVMHSCQKIEERLKLDPNLDSILQGLIRIAKESGTKA